MRYYDMIGWLGTAGVLLAYASGNLKIFAVANVCFFVPVALPQVIRKAYSGAAISVTFGILSAITLIRGI